MRKSGRMVVIGCLVGLVTCIGLVGCKDVGKGESKPGEAAAFVPPTIDGDLGDACYKDAEVTGDWTDVDTGEKAKTKSKVCVCSDDQNLYIAIHNPEPKMKTVAADITDRDGHVWEDDSNEIFLDPTGKRQSYYQIIVNTRETVFDASVTEAGASKDVAWDAKATVKVVTAPDSWTLELAVPLASLGVKGSPKGQTWAANFCRNQCQQGDEAVGSGWAPIEGSFHTPADFKDLTLK